MYMFDGILEIVLAWITSTSTQVLGYVLNSLYYDEMMTNRPSRTGGGISSLPTSCTCTWYLVLLLPVEIENLNLMYILAPWKSHMVPLNKCHALLQGRIDR
jgi:hypothetical protein